MAYQEVISLDADVTISLGGFNKKEKRDNPTEIEGFYLGSRQVESAKSKTGKSALHFFKTAEGNVAVWGKTDLDKKLNQVKLGTMTKAQFIGMKETRNNPMYSFLVQTDADQTIDVSAITTSTAGYETGSDQLESGGYEEEEDDALDEAPYVAPKAPSRPAQPPSADAQARVKALLGARKAG